MILNRRNDQRQFSAEATRQITQIAKLMAIELDPNNPRHADLLEGLERALLSLRKESNGQPESRSHLDLQNRNDAPACVLHGGNLGMDIAKEEHF